MLCPSRGHPLPAPTQFPWLFPVFLCRPLPFHWKNWLASASALQTHRLRSDQCHMSRVSQPEYTGGVLSSAQAKAHHFLLCLTTLPTPQAHIRRATGLPGLRQDAAAHIKPGALPLSPVGLPMKSFLGRMYLAKGTGETQVSLSLCICLS